MKYMGSKRTMLGNGLGELLRREASRHKRFIDLFSGSGAVAWFVGRETSAQVVAFDIQKYAAVLAQSVIGRTRSVDPSTLMKSFIGSARAGCTTNCCWHQAQALDRGGLPTPQWVTRARTLCGTGDAGKILQAYGGHYFSPSQAVAIDSLIGALPEKKTDHDLCLAALLIAASDCAASPGHTAQPFQPTKTAGMYIRESWKKDIFFYVEKALSELAPLYARTRGAAGVRDAVTVAARLTECDLVFIDPPYAGVHYSRFYHVLESIARGRCDTVSGVGRYPPPAERPASAFSRKGQSRQAFAQLMCVLAERGCTVIVTFPAGECSNGLSGQIVSDLASQYFRVETKKVASRFSTLGGNNSHRKARIHVEELILHLRPKARYHAAHNTTASTTALDR